MVLVMTFPVLYEHQAKAVSEMHNGCILRGGVGSGKTRTALAYYSRLAPWIKLYVITTAKKRDSGDWEAEAKLWGVDVVVDSWNNLFEYTEVRDAFFIFDEQRVVGSGVWVQSFLEVCKVNEWILLSATPGDTWLDYIPVFIANGFYKNRTEFIRQHVVFSTYTKYPKVERYTDGSILAGHLADITVDMPFERHTKRHLVEVHVDYDRELFDTVWRKRWNYREGRPVRHVSELFSLLRRVAYSDSSRLQRVADLLVQHPKIIVFYNFDYELDLLRTLDVKKAEWNGHKHEPIPDGDEWIYLVQYSSGAEGWNCTDTDTTVFYSLTYSYKVFEQAQGRTDRMDTPFTELHYYILMGSSLIDRAVYKAIKEKKSFSEARFMAKRQL
jgi:hypothetical protein